MGWLVVVGLATRHAIRRVATEYRNEHRRVLKQKLDYEALRAAFLHGLVEESGVDLTGRPASAAALQAEAARQHLRRAKSAYAWDLRTEFRAFVGATWAVPQFKMLGSLLLASVLYLSRGYVLPFQSLAVLLLVHIMLRIAADSAAGHLTNATVYRCLLRNVVVLLIPFICAVFIEGGTAPLGMPTEVQAGTVRFVTLTAYGWSLIAALTLVLRAVRSAGVSVPPSVDRFLGPDDDRPS